MLTEESLRDILADGENMYVEFKEKLDNPNSLASEIVAFLNSEGGRIFFGIYDNGEVCGISDFNNLEEKIVNICRNNCVPGTTPPIKKKNFKGKTVMVVEIEKGKDKPYKTKQNYYFIRVGSTKRRASREELSRLFQSSGLLHYDEMPVPTSTVNDIDIETVRKYYLQTFNKDINKINIGLEQFLENIKVVKRNSEGINATVAGLLIFGKAPQDFLPYSKISAVKLMGNSMSGTIIDRQDFFGTLPEMLENCEKFFLRNIRKTGNIEGLKRTDTLEYPGAAFRELLINAAVHRNYSIAGSHNRIFIFEDYLEVKSPGRLPNTITLENIKYGNHYTRNPLICKFLINLGYMEDIGLGIPKIYDLMKEFNGTEPEFEIRGYEFIARLKSR